MSELPKETKLYKVEQTFAKGKGIPTIFAARPIIQTEKAIYFYGHGTTESVKTGVCMACGKKLTHPVSVKYGIGPICGDHFYIPINDEDAIPEKIKQNMRVDNWIPKSCIEENWDCETEVHIPEKHPMLNNKKETGKEAIQVTYKDSQKKGIKITFPFNYDDLANVKTLSGRRFHNEGANKYWTCPLNIESAEALQEWGFELDQGLQDFLNKSKINVNELSGTTQVEEGLKGKLRPFQRKGVEFLEQRDGRALIGDEMGLGKTIQTIAYLQLHPEKRPAIIVCPASLKLNWLKELHEWMVTPNVQVLGGKNPNMPIIGDILIINYDILDSWVNKLKQINPQILTIDEIHYIKNNQAKRTKATKKLCKDIPHIIGLGGTLIVNRPYEGFNAIKLIDDTVIPSFWKYVQRYCGAKHNGFGWDFSGATNTDELHEKLVNTIMIRRKKEDVLTDLPPKVYSTIPFEINNQKEYKRAESDFIQYITETKGEKAAKKASNAEVLTRINELKQISVRGKLKQAKDWIKNFIESNGKLVVFTIHKETIDALIEEFGEQAVKVDGSVSGQKREEAVEQFQNDESIRLFVGNIQAAGVGITLTAASSVAFLELPWTPGELQQASDRVHRIGQYESVNIYYLLASRTIEEEITKLIDKKRQVLDSVLDGKETDQESLLSELMKAYEA